MAPVFFRFFKNRPAQDVVQTPDGRWRVASSAFRTREMSLDDGEICAAAETERRNAPCGVASIEKAVMAAKGVVVVEAKEPGNDAHCTCVGTISSPTAKAIQRASRVEVPYPGLQMVHGDNSPVL